MIEPSKQSPRTVIDIGSEVQGLLKGRGFLEIRGKVTGPIIHDGTLLIAAAGRCEGHVQATDVIIAGEARGDVTANGRLEITATGRLIGDAIYGTFVVAAGGIFHGHIRMQESPERIPELTPSPAPAPVKHSGSDEPDSADQPPSHQAAMQTIRSPLPDQEPQPKPRWGVALLRSMVGGSTDRR